MEIMNVEQCFVKCYNCGETSQPQRKDAGKEITRWIKPGKKFETGQHGMLTAHEWLLKEKERIEKDGIRCVVLTDHDGLECLCYA